MFDHVAEDSLAAALFNLEAGLPAAGMARDQLRYSQPQGIDPRDNVTGGSGSKPNYYHADQIPSEAKRENEKVGGAERARLEAASSVAEGVHRAISSLKAPEPATKQQLHDLNRKIRGQEEVALNQWASKNGLLLDAGEFERRWKHGGEKEGAEHRVILDEASGRVIKSNDITSFHGNWLEYFHRIELHNWLFPEAALRFEGLMQTDRGLEADVSQAYISSKRGATRAETEAEMAKLGFRRTEGDDYNNPNLGISVQDLHDENVLIGKNGELLVMDPMIVLTGVTRMLGSNSTCRKAALSPPASTYPTRTRTPTSSRARPRPNCAPPVTITCPTCSVSPRNRRRSWSCRRSRRWHR